ncbi:unnamed protein product [Rhizophagus irregularis]|uniref:t-SNARE coiled-coil homology domain-containing protein n=1 Tax=Rhizophagus irregularis TaxID=588596 RepID=A0A2N1NUU8_9GLOM|nr:hypothetical protein RhiirC2_731525 [Rhizophagus irregularis]CAB4375356.1 unnamed protein product [Rhizophagus irregularis]
MREKDKKIKEIDKEIQENNEINQEKDKLIQEKDNLIQELVNRIQEKDKIIKEKNNKIQKIVEEKDKRFKKKIEIQELEQDISILEKENSEYQYALDAATNFDDKCKYNLDKLKEVILNLQHSLKIYITECKDNVEINIPEVQNLLDQYGSQTDITKDQKTESFNQSSNTASCYRTNS